MGGTCSAEHYQSGITIHGNYTIQLCSFDHDVVITQAYPEGAGVQGHTVHRHMPPNYTDQHFHVFRTVAFSVKFGVVCQKFTLP